MGGSTWEPERKTSFRWKAQRTRLKEALVKGLYGEQSERMRQTPEAFHFDDFKIRDGKLYYRDKTVPLMTKRNELRSVGVILGREGLHDLGFHTLVEGKVTAQQTVMLNRVEEELPSASVVAKSYDIELRRMQRKARRT